MPPFHQCGLPHPWPRPIANRCGTPCRISRLPMKPHEPRADGLVHTDITQQGKIFFSPRTTVYKFYIAPIWHKCAKAVCCGRNDAVSSRKMRRNRPSCPIKTPPWPRMHAHFAPSRNRSPSPTQGAAEQIDFALLPGRPETAKNSLPR